MNDRKILIIPIAIVTSGYISKVESMMDQFGIKDYIEGYITAEKVSKGKPDPEPYIKGAAILKRPTGTCVVFEDSVSGTKSAIGAGSDVIGVNKESFWGKLEEEGSFHQINDFRDLKFEKYVLKSKTGVPLISFE